MFPLIGVIPLILGLVAGKATGMYRAIDSVVPERFYRSKGHESKGYSKGLFGNQRGSVILSNQSGYNDKIRKYVESRRYREESKGEKGSRTIVGSSMCGIQDAARLDYELRRRESEWNFLKRWLYGRRAKKEAEIDMWDYAEQEVDNYDLTIEKREEQSRLRTGKTELENSIERLKVLESNSGKDLGRLKEQEQDLYQIVHDLSYIGMEIITQKRTRTESPANIRTSYEKACRRLFNEGLVPEPVKAHLSQLDGLIKSYLNGEEVDPELLETLAQTGEKTVRGIYGSLVNSRKTALEKVGDMRRGYEATIVQIDSEITEINGAIEELKELEHKKRMESEAYRVRTLQRQVEYWIRDSGERERVMELERKRDETVEELGGLGKNMLEALKYVIYPKDPSASEEKKTPKEKKENPNPVQE